MENLLVCKQRYKNSQTQSYINYLTFYYYPNLRLYDYLKGNIYKLIFFITYFSYNVKLYLTLGL